MRAWLLLAIGGVVLAAAWWAAQPTDDVVEVSLRVEMPDGLVLANGTYAGATVLDVLLAASEVEGFTVDVDASAAYGGCARFYVVAIGGVEETAGGGWVFEIDDGTGWSMPVTGAGCVNPTPGQSIRWRWTDDPTV